jgi:hypothetical protein
MSLKPNVSALNAYPYLNDPGYDPSANNFNNVKSRQFLRKLRRRSRVKDGAMTFKASAALPLNLFEASFTDRIDDSSVYVGFKSGDTFSPAKAKGVVLSGKTLNGLSRFAAPNFYGFGFPGGYPVQAANALSLYAKDVADRDEKFALAKYAETIAVPGVKVIPMNVNEA